MNDSEWDETLLREVASFQAQLILLDGQADQLTELGDIQFYRRLNSDIDDYIGAHAQAGNLPDNPLKEIEARIIVLNHFFAECEDLQKNLLKPYNRFLKNASRVSLREISTALAQFPGSDQLLRCLDDIAAKLSPLDWNGIDANADVHVELLLCAQALGIKLPADNRKRCQMRLLAQRTGTIFREICLCLDQVPTTLRELVETHTRHRDTLAKEKWTPKIGPVAKLDFSGSAGHEKTAGP